MLDRANEFVRARVGDIATIRKVGGVDPHEYLLDEEADRLDAFVADCLHDFLEPLRAELDGRDGGVAVIDAAVLRPLPVCLAGYGNFHVQTRDGAMNVPVLLQVLPSQEETRIGMLASGPRADHLARYAKMFVWSHGPLATIEAWMLNGTDNWFLTPSVWERLSPGRRARIEAELRDDARSIGEPAAERIFDELREPD